MIPTDFAINLSILCKLYYSLLQITNSFPFSYSAALDQRYNIIIILSSCSYYALVNNNYPQLFFIFLWWMK